MKHIKEFYQLNELRNPPRQMDVARIEYERERKELLDSIVKRLNRASLEQLQNFKYILGW